MHRAADEKSNYSMLFHVCLLQVRCKSWWEREQFLVLGCGLELHRKQNASALAWVTALTHMPMLLNFSLHPSSLSIPPSASCKCLQYLLPTFPSKTSCPVLETSKHTRRASSLLCFRLCWSTWWLPSSLPQPCPIQIIRWPREAL